MGLEEGNYRTVLDAPEVAEHRVSESSRRDTLREREDRPRSPARPAPVGPLVSWKRDTVEREWRHRTGEGGSWQMAAGRRQSIESTQFLSPLSRERWDATESRNSIDSSGAGSGHTKESSGQQSAIICQRANGQLGKTEGRDRWSRSFREREIEGLSGLPYSNRPKQRLLAARSSMRDVGRLLFLSRTLAPWCILRA